MSGIWQVKLFKINWGNLMGCVKLIWINVVDYKSHKTEMP